MSCDRPGVPPNARLRLVSGIEYVYGSEVEVTCNPGYQLSGSSNRSCQANGQWSGRVPSCQSKLGCTIISWDLNNRKRDLWDMLADSFGTEIPLHNLQISLLEEKTRIPLQEVNCLIASMTHRCQAVVRIQD